MERDHAQILQEVSLEMCVQYQVTINIKKTGLLLQPAEFVGVDLKEDRNRPASLKMGEVNKLKQYQDYIPNLELQVAHYLR